MENKQAGHGTTHIAGDDSTHEPAEHEGKTSDKTLDQPLAEEHVNTQEQRNQDWTRGGAADSRRDNAGEPLRTDTTSAPPLDMPDELEAKLDDVMANPHSDAQEGEGAPPEDPGGEAKTGSGEQDPMRQTGGGQSGG